MGAMAPMMLSMTAGSMLGHLARRSFGQYDLPVPRPPSDELVLVAPNVAEFGEAWSLPRDDLLAVGLRARDRPPRRARRAPRPRRAHRRCSPSTPPGSRPTPGGLEERLGDVSLDDPSALASLQETFGDPEVLLGAIRSDAQRALLPRLEALVAGRRRLRRLGHGQVGGTLIGSYGQLTEALRRRRVEADASDRFVEQLLGLELTQAAYDRGIGVRRRASSSGPAPRASSGCGRASANLPTPAEVDAPGLWLARIELPDLPD